MSYKTYFNLKSTKVRFIYCLGKAKIYIYIYIVLYVKSIMCKMKNYMLLFFLNYAKHVFKTYFIEWKGYIFI